MEAEEKETEKTIPGPDRAQAKPATSIFRIIFKLQ